MSNDEKTETKEPMAGLTLRFVKLIVRDITRMQTFYEKVCGFKFAAQASFEQAEEVILDLPSGGVSLVLYRWKDEREITLGNNHGPIVFLTSDVDGYYHRALSAGANELKKPFNVGTIRAAFVKDPEGHELEFAHLGDAF